MVTSSMDGVAQQQRWSLPEQHIQNRDPQTTSLVLDPHTLLLWYFDSEADFITSKKHYLERHLLLKH